MIFIEEWFIVLCDVCAKEIGRSGIPSGAESIADNHNAEEHPEARQEVAFQ